ncbi:unnamed protein product, partial [marine sediment metagenome]
GWIISSHSNLVYWNYFYYNGQPLQAFDSGTNNNWDNGTIGNYWSDYGGVDADDDGIGDTSYSISGSAVSQDNYPIWDDGININKYFFNKTWGGIAEESFHDTAFDANGNIYITGYTSTNTNGEDDIILLKYTSES